MKGCNRKTVAALLKLLEIEKSIDKKQKKVYI